VKFEIFDEKTSKWLNEHKLAVLLGIPVGLAGILLEKYIYMYVVPINMALFFSLGIYALINWKEMLKGENFLIVIAGLTTFMNPLYDNIPEFKRFTEFHHLIWVITILYLLYRYRGNKEWTRMFKSGFKLIGISLAIFFLISFVAILILITFSK